tara:strand:+ start:1188 stop:2105 length:918 start_codon:yes stop_codon:yes gene_type:complete
MIKKKVGFIVESNNSLGGVETIFRNLAHLCEIYRFRTKTEVIQAIKSKKLNYEIIIFNQPFSTLLLCLFNKINRKSKLFYLIHINFNEGKFIRKIFASFFFKFLNYFNVKLLFFSETMSRNYTKNDFKIVPPPVFKYPNRIKEFCNTKEREINFLFVGRYENQKGADILKEISTNIGKKIIAIGKGSIEIDSEFIDDLGPMTIDLVYKQMEKSKVLLLPSRFEGFGLVILEAISMGCKVVAFNCDYGPGDLKKMFPNDIYLVEKNNIKEFAKTAQRVLSMELEDTNNKIKLLNTYTPENFIKSLE